MVMDEAEGLLVNFTKAASVKYAIVRGMLRLPLFFLLFLSLLGAQAALAHNSDQLPFVQIDGLDAKVYSVPSTSLTDFPLPQDAASKSHLPGETVTVGIITQNLPILPEFVPKTLWRWDFGDGTSADGLQASHSYRKPGSYLIDLHSTTGSDTPQLLDRIQMNILPTADYVLPKAVLSIDGKIPSNPYTDILDSTYGYAARFDGSQSTGSALTYFWDFGDTATANTSTADHTFHAPYLYASTLLRVVDSNGLIGDEFAQLQGLDKSGALPLPVVTSIPQPTSSWKPYAVIVAILAIGVGVMVVIKRT